MRSELFRPEFETVGRPDRRWGRRDALVFLRDGEIFVGPRDVSLETGGGQGGGCTQFVHGRGRMTIDLRGGGITID